MTPKRAYSLDALRGYAIVTMILSGTIAYGVLPGWMYHAQCPPPNHIFNPNIFGITWVDLVFPFFLFAMGAAFPFSIGTKLEQGLDRSKLVWDTLLRAAKLGYFAIYLQHLYPWVIASPQTPRAWTTALIGFLLLFPMYMRSPWKIRNWLQKSIHLAAYALGALLILSINYTNGRTFNPGFSNIIILVLANMALFGGIIYIYTHKHPWTRIAILPFIMAIFLGSTTEGSWVESVYNFSPLPWFYKFYYLKYLFIVIPGTIAGEYLKQWSEHKKAHSLNLSERRELPIILSLSIAIILCNLYGLYTRQLVLNLTVTAALLTVLYQFIKSNNGHRDYWLKLFRLGAYLLLLGLCFEAFEGGIRKDHSTYSYYFVTSGLAAIFMIALSINCDIYQAKWISKPFEMAGQNPMIAYVATNILIMPLINLAQLTPLLDSLSTTAWGGLFRGIIVTTLATATAIFFSRIKWFWRT